MKDNAVRKLNFRYAGAVLDVNRLIGKGWEDMTGVCPEGEYVRYDSTWVGLTETIEGLDYHVMCSFSTTNAKKNEDGSWKLAKGDYMQKAHTGEVPRFAFFRRVQVWVCDPKAMTYERLKGDLPAMLVARIGEDLKESVIDPARGFSDDIDFQTECIKSPDSVGMVSPIDRCFLKLETVLESCKKTNGTESVARLLAPFARAVLTGDDPDGRELAYGISSARVVSAIAWFGEWCDFPEATVAVYRVARRNDITEELGAGTFANFVRSALRMDSPKEAADALRFFFARLKKMDDKEEQSNLSCVVYRAVRDFCSSLPGDADGLEALVLEFESHLGVFGDDPEPGLLCALAKAYVHTLRGNEIGDEQVGLITAFLKPYVERYDAEHAKDLEKFPYLKDLSPGIRAPLPWQAMIMCVAGDPGRALKSFPVPVFEDERDVPARPAAEAVEGLSSYDIWSGLKSMEWDESSWRKFEKQICADLEPCGKPIDAGISWSWLGRMSRADAYQILESKAKTQEELSIMGVQTTEKGEDGEQKALEKLFPFLPKEYPDNVPNVTAKVWRTFLWDDGVAADVEFQLESGRMMTAVMPYYVWDRHCLARGLRGQGMLVGFAQSLKRLPPPKPHDPIVVKEGPLVKERGKPVTLHFDEHFDDWFDQDTIHESISRAGFGLQGRVKSVRELEAFGEKTLAVEIESIRLDSPLRVYIAAEKVESPLAVGDTVEAFGWLYLDFFEIIDDFKAAMDECGGHLPGCPETKGWKSMVPDFIRTEYSEEELKGRPVPEPDWYRYGLNRLEQIKGVTRVVPCPMNPRHVDYLVRRDGKVEAYSLIVTDDDKKPCIVYPGTRTMVLRRRKEGNGVRLSWEGLPE